MRQIFRLPLAVLLMAFAGACAAPATVGNMATSSPVTQSEAKASPFYENIAVGTVYGGEPTNLLQISKVDNSSFRQALELSLANTFGTPRAAPKYTVSANLGGLDQPIAGASMTVKSFVRYEVQDNASKTTVFNEHITARHTAKFSDALIGATRMRYANEGSIRANITAFLRMLLATELPEEPAESENPKTSTELGS